MPEPELRVNEAFAERYRRYRRREELQRLRDRYGDSGDSEDSSESEESSSGDEVSLDPRQEREFLRTLALLKTKDPCIYRPDTTFYTRPESSSGSEEEEEEDEEPQAESMFLKDYERKVVLEKEGKYVDEEDEEDEKAAAERRKLTASRSYVEEQRELKESFKAFIADSEDEDEEGGGGSALLRPRSRTAQEKEREEQEYSLWLKGQGEAPPEPLQDLVPLRQFWSDPGLDPGERFLRDYLLDQSYRREEEEEEEEEEAEGADSSDEGELFLARQEQFERSYNFRFEEPEGEQVRTFPRSIPSSVRRPQQRRREQRQRRQERKQREKVRKQEELKQLKNLKRQELAARLARLHQAMGTSEGTQGTSEGTNGTQGTGGITAAWLQEDFDPQRHDQLMAELFGEDFYCQGAEQKPQFEAEEELEEENWNWDTWAGKEEEEEEEEAKAEPHCEDPDFVMDADFDPSSLPLPRRPPAPRSKRHRTRFRELLERPKPTFDPASSSFEQYLEEFYSLDYEDLIGDLPCRFKYRTVLPCDFGLTTQEILAADDKELNRWCSLRKTCMYRSEQEERQDQANYSRRAQNLWKKKQIFKSLMAESEDPQVAPKEEVQGRRKKGKRKRSEEDGDGDGGGAVVTPLKPPRKEGGGSGRRRGGVPLGSAVRLGGQEFSGKRLEAFGLNPKRLRYRQLLRQTRRKKKGGGGKGGEKGGGGGKEGEKGGGEKGRKEGGGGSKRDPPLKKGPKPRGGTPQRSL